MGWFSSSEEIESHGEINNNVIVDDTVKNSQHKEISSILYIIAGVIVIVLIMKLFQIYNKQMKKKYSRSREVLWISIQLTYKLNIVHVKLIPRIEMFVNRKISGKKNTKIHEQLKLAEINAIYL